MNWQPFIRGGATCGVLLSIVCGLAWSQNAQAPAAPPPATVHLDLTADQLNVVLLGLQELKFKDVLSTYMAIVNQTASPAPAPAPQQSGSKIVPTTP